MHRLLKTCEKFLYSESVRDKDFIDIVLFANRHEIEELESQIINHVAK